MQCGFRSWPQIETNMRAAYYECNPGMMAWALGTDVCELDRG